MVRNIIYWKELLFTIADKVLIVSNHLRQIYCSFTVPFRMVDIFSFCLDSMSSQNSPMPELSFIDGIHSQTKEMMSFPNYTTIICCLLCVIRRRKWKPTPVFLPGESHGLKTLVGHSPRCRKEADMTEWLHITSLHV